MLVIFYHTPFTNLYKDINVAIENLYLFFFYFNRCSETQTNFNSSTRSDFVISFDGMVTGEQLLGTGTEYQKDIGCKAKNSPNILKAAHQTENKSC